MLNCCKLSSPKRSPSQLLVLSCFVTLV